MCDRSRGPWVRRAAAATLTSMLMLLAPVVAAGQGGRPDTWRNATRLGGTTSFYAPPLEDATSLKQMVRHQRIADDIRAVLHDSGIPDTSDAVLATLGGTTAIVAGTSCNDATPTDGTIVACDFQTGSTLLWMAYRPEARRGVSTPHRLERIRWAGEKPFRAFLFRVTRDHRAYTFVLPLACANLSLMSVTDLPGAPVDMTVDRTCDPATGAMRAVITASSPDVRRVSRVSVAIDGRPAGEVTAPSWTFVASRPGDYTFAAFDAAGQPYPMTGRTLRIEACPQPPVVRPVMTPTCNVTLTASPARRGAYILRVDATRSTSGVTGVRPRVVVDVHDDTGAIPGGPFTLDDSLTGTVTARRAGTYRVTATVTMPEGAASESARHEGAVTCQGALTIDKPDPGLSVFASVLGGKERRVRPIEDTDLWLGQCSPLIGVKLGLLRRFPNNWEIAGAVGVAISLVTDDDKVKESALFVDAEVNRYFESRAFVGTGISLWDLTRRDTWTPAWLVHAGVPLYRSSPRPPVYLMAEGRVFFDNADDIANNYQFWAGVRVSLNRR